MENELRLLIKGDPSELDAVALQRGLGALLSLLRAKGIKDVVLSRLELSSHDLAVRPRVRADEVDGQFRAIVKELDGLNEFVPESASASMLEAAKELADVLQIRGVEGIEVGDDQLGAKVEVSEDLGRNVHQALSRTTISVGSVKGRVHRFNNDKNRREIAVRDEATDRAVTISFPKSMEPEIERAVNHRIVAWGELRRDRSGRKKRLRLDGFELVPDVAQGEDMAGALGEDWTWDAGSVEAVRDQRRG